MVKYVACSAVLAIFCASAYAAEAPQRNKFQKAVDAQRESDLKRKNELIARMKAIIGSYNKRLKQSGVKDANLDMPLAPDKIEGIEDMETHTDKVVPPPVYAFVSEDVHLLASSATSTTVGKVWFSDRVEVLEKAGTPFLYKGHDGEMCLIRKDNGEEGWIHSSLLLTKKPEKRQQKVNAPEDASAFDVPVSGRRSSSFGSRVDPVTKKRNAFHSGIDIAAPKGTPVAAAQSGIVRKAEFNKNGYGNLIVLEHQKDFTTYYGHLSTIKVTPGQSVKKGDNIGAVGSTGKSTGPHLHFEVRRGDTALDPDSFLK